MAVKDPAGIPVRPSVLSDDMLEYLDELRESGKVNMFGATPLVASHFGLRRSDAVEVVTFWMHTFALRHPETQIGDNE